MWVSRILALWLGVLATVGTPVWAASRPPPILRPEHGPFVDADLGFFGVGGAIGAVLSSRVGLVFGADLGQFLGLPIPVTKDPWPFPLVSGRVGVRLATGRRSHVDLCLRGGVLPQPGGGDIFGGGFELSALPAPGAAQPVGNDFSRTVQAGILVDLRLGEGRPLLGPRVTLDYGDDGRLSMVIVPLMLRWSA